MNTKSQEIIFAEELPHDLFAKKERVPIYDCLKEATTGEEEEFPIPYNAEEARWLSSPTKKVERYLFEKLFEASYSIWKPTYMGESFSLLATKGANRFLFVILLDSESERKLWKALALKDKYKIVIVRDRKIEEPSPLISASVDELFDSLKILSV